MLIDPRVEAQRLLGTVDPDFLPDLAGDPFGTIEVIFDDLTIVTRPPSPAGLGCAVDGIYDPGPPSYIRVANDVSPARQRFTALHELGHHLVEHDDHLNDMDVPDAQRRDEDICNEVAASVLLPDEMVSKCVPAGRFTAADVARLHTEAASPSRAACCVAAVRQLHVPGCVILGRPDGTADFVAHQPATPWRVARGTQQGADSLLVRAATSSIGHVRAETVVRFATGAMSNVVHGDAFSSTDGWVYMVVAADSHSPWVTSLNFASPDTRARSEVVECPRCDDAFTAWWARCRTCGDHQCPQCHRCSCESSRAATKTCDGCGLIKSINLFPNGGRICVDCE